MTPTISGGGANVVGSGGRNGVDTSACQKPGLTPVQLQACYLRAEIAAIQADINDAVAFEKNLGAAGCAHADPITNHCNWSYKSFAERLTTIRHLAGSGQPVRQVPSSDRGARQGATDRDEVNRQAERSQTIDHPMNAMLTSDSNRGAGRNEFRLVIANEIAEDVKLTTFVLGGQLDPADEFHAQPKCLGTGDGKGGNRVVVGDGEGSKAEVGGGLDHFAGRARAIGVGRMNVEVGRSGSRHPSVGSGFGGSSTAGATLGVMSEFWSRSRIPFTNRLDWAVL